MTDRGGAQQSTVIRVEDTYPNCRSTPRMCIHWLTNHPTAHHVWWTAADFCELRHGHDDHREPPHSSITMKQVQKIAKKATLTRPRAMIRCFPPHRASESVEGRKEGRSDSGVIKTGVNQECGRPLGVVAPAIRNANVQTRSFKFGFQLV